MSEQKVPPVYHMTLALGYSPREEEEIIREYFHKFGKDPLPLRVGRLGVYIFTRWTWREIFSIKLGGQK